MVADEYHEKSALEPPPPRSRNYWRTAQAWLPRKVPETRQDVVALRQRSQGMKTGIVSKSHLVSINVDAVVIAFGSCTGGGRYMKYLTFWKTCIEHCILLLPYNPKYSQSRMLAKFMDS